MEIAFNNLSKIYGKTTAVDDVSFTLTQGVCALLGANGSGKTTLIKMLCGLLKPTSGNITCDGKDIVSLGASYRDILGYLPQNFGYYPEFRVYDFLLYMCAVKGIEGNLANERCNRVLYRVDLFNERNIRIRNLSGGMIQRLGIAQAMLNEPSVIILDEPTAGLDPKERIRFRNLVSELAGERIILYSTHIISDIEYIADKVIIMRNGITTSNPVPPAELLAQAEGTVWYVKARRSEVPSLLENLPLAEFCLLILISYRFALYPKTCRV